MTIDTTAQFNALELNPIRLSTELHISRHLVAQAKDRSLEQFLANEILKNLAAVLDKIVLNGQSATNATASAPGLLLTQTFPVLPLVEPRVGLRFYRLVTQLTTPTFRMTREAGLFPRTPSKFLRQRRNSLAIRPSWLT